MTVLVLITKKGIYHTAIHSNWHHLKVIKGIVDHFTYNWLGGCVGNKHDITPKDLMKKITKFVKPYEIYEWKKELDLRDHWFRESLDGYIIMNVNSGKGCNGLYINISNSEPDTNIIYEQFKETLKERR